MLKKFYLILFLTMFSCSDFFSSSSKVIKEGEKLDVTFYSLEQPEKLSDYNQFASMVVGDGIAIVKPDTIPELIKIIHIDSDLSIDMARIDKDGYIWFAADTFDKFYDSNEYIYLINPHSGEIHKSIKLPNELRGPDSIVFGKDKVFISSKKISLGSIDRNNFTVETLTISDNYGWALSPGLEFINDNLYYFGYWTNENFELQEDNVILQFDTEKNKLVREVFYSGHYTFDENYFYTNGYFSIGDTVLPRLYKLNISDLRVEQEILFNNKSYIACDEEFLYSANRINPIVDVYRKSDLEKVRTIDFSDITKIQRNYFNNNFGFITKELLMLNQASFYNVKTGEILDYIFSLNYHGAEGLVLAEGLELKSFE